MTWFASQIMTTGTARSLAAVRCNPLFQKNTFHVKNPLDHNWHRPEVIHDVPSEGILFIRPICERDSYEAEWHEADEAILSWDQFEGLNGADIMVNPEDVKQRFPQIEWFRFPPAQVLRVAKQLYLETQNSVVFYSCFFWGGSIEIEYAWIFDGPERLIYRLGDSEDQVSSQILEVGENSEKELEGDVLCLALQALSCNLSTGFFAPHTRGFDWERVRI